MIILCHVGVWTRVSLWLDVFVCVLQDKKYGFGGRDKKRAKMNDSKSLNNFKEFNPRGGKFNRLQRGGKGGKGGKAGAGKNRPGKDARKAKRAGRSG